MDEKKKSLNSPDTDENVRTHRKLLEWNHKLGIDVCGWFLVLYLSCLCELTFKHLVDQQGRN